MFMETPETLLYVAGGAFLLGWLVGKIGAYFGNRFKAKQRDPRDDRIRSLDAELRIAQGDLSSGKTEIEELKAELADRKTAVEQRDTAILAQQEKIAQLKSDLKDSVMKTRELRAELSNRAAENVRSEVKLREVETELSVAQASTDMLATGVLDYSVAPDSVEDELGPARKKADSGT